MSADMRSHHRSLLALSLVVTTGWLAVGCGSSSGGGGPGGSDDAGGDGETGADATTDVAEDSSVDSSSVDSGTSLDTSAAMDSGASADTGPGAEAGADSGTTVDASLEAGDGAVEASAEASVEAGPEAGHDSGADASGPCTVSSQCSGGLVCIGGACTSTVLLLAGSSTSLLAGTFEAGSGWSTSALSDATTMQTALTVDSTGRGVGAYVSTTGGYVSSTVWSNGAWAAPAAITTLAFARAQPSIDATGGATSHLVYQGTDFKFYYLAYAGSWSASPIAVGTATDPFYGPVPASVAALGGNATAVFVDGESSPANLLGQSDLTGGAWQARFDFTTAGGSFTVPPVVVPLRSGPELLTVFVLANGQLASASRTGGAWSTPASIPNGLTNDPPALAPLPGGGAILAFRGQDTNLYWTVYAVGTWSVIGAFATPNVSIAYAPAVTHGIAGDVAEIAFVETDGKAYHSRLTGSTWSAPVLVGGTSLTGVAIAAAP
jgi:hypothetical protein